MNILLIYPKYPNTFWSFKHVLNFISKKAAFPPLGLLTIASMLPKDWNKKLIDENVEILRDENIEWADLIFISGMIVQKESAQEIIKRCREKNKKIVAGGPLFTIQYENFEGVDHFILNEGEITLPLFLKDFENGTLKPIYTSDEKPNLTKTPLPSWELINFKNYASMAIQYSRGCPFNCEFCDIIVMNGRIPRTKIAEQFIREFQALYDAGWRGSIFVVDDNFIGNKFKVKSMLQELIIWQELHDYPFTLLTEASINLADDDELMNLMTKANFSKVFLGIETPNIESLKECGKIQNTKKDLGDSIKTIQQHGLQVMGGFILGFDNDTENIFETQIKFIQKIGVVVAMTGILIALPQTRLWHRLKTEGRLLKETSGNNTDAVVNFIPKMGAEKLVTGYKNVISTIYSPKEYYSRIHTFIKHYKPKLRSKLKTEDVGAFIKSIWKIGVLSKAKKYYWKLLIATFFKKRKALPIAIELAIYGEHFQKIMKQAM